VECGKFDWLNELTSKFSHLKSTRLAYIETKSDDVKESPIQFLFRPKFDKVFKRRLQSDVEFSQISSLIQNRWQSDGQSDL